MMFGSPKKIRMSRLGDPKFDLDHNVQRKEGVDASSARQMAAGRRNGR